MCQQMSVNVIQEREQLIADHKEAMEEAAAQHASEVQEMTNQAEAASQDHQEAMDAARVAAEEAAQQHQEASEKATAEHEEAVAALQEEMVRACDALFICDAWLHTYVLLRIDSSKTVHGVYFAGVAAKAACDSC